MCASANQFAGVLSVIIPSYNTCELLERCLTSLVTENSRCSREVIVVDNASKDASVAMVSKKFPNVCLLASPKNIGFGAACNYGFSASKGDYVLFLNSDTEVPSGALDELCAIMNEDPSVGTLSPRLKGSHQRLLQMTWEWEPSFLGELKRRIFSSASIKKSFLIKKWVDFLQKDDKNVPCVAGAALMTRRTVFEKLRGFDERFKLYFEDSDFCRRVRKSGLAVRFTPRVEVINHLGQSMKMAETKTNLIYRQSQIYYYQKHAGWLENFLLSLYLRGKFFNMYFLPVLPEHRRIFYEKMRRVINREIRIELD